MKPNNPTPPTNTNTKNQKRKNDDYEKDSPLQKKFSSNVQSSPKANGKTKNSPANKETAPQKTISSKPPIRIKSDPAQNKRFM